MAEGRSLQLTLKKIMKNYILNLFFCRGTNAFSLAISDNNVNFTTVLNGNLPDARDKTCGTEIPLLEFDINRHATFVKVTLISYFGRSAGLQYINFITA